MFASAELPVANGFAEQKGCTDASMASFAPSDSDEAVENGDEVAEALSTTPACSHASLMKSLSDVIVFGTNWANEMGKSYRLEYK